jgi:hypothetical protein
MNRLQSLLSCLEDQAPSDPLHHRSGCCDSAIAWLVARLLGAGSSWQSIAVRPGKVLKWGDTQWPTSWCSLVERDYFDSVAMAAAAEITLLHAGFVPERVQFVVDCSDTARHSLDRDPGALVYVEGVSVRGEPEMVVPYAQREVRLAQPFAFGECIALRRWVAGLRPIWQYVEPRPDQAVRVG